MKLREIVLAGAIFLSGAVFSQDKLHFDVYSREEGFLNLLKSSFLRVSSKEVDFSFLFGIYSMSFKKINDSIYQEVVKDNWALREEFFDYSLEDSCYTLIRYSAKRGKPRQEKKALEERIFDKKYRVLPELFSNFKNGLLGDSLHFIVNGMPYSVKINSRENGESIIYSCNLGELIKREPGDNILFPYPIEVYAIKKNGELLPLGFSTEFLKVRSGKKVPIKGKLKEN
ncbi:MAG: hypothetical protein AABY32_06570 [Nanoarchaeota archaeon]